MGPRATWYSITLVLVTGGVIFVWGLVQTGSGASADAGVMAWGSALGEPLRSSRLAADSVPRGPAQRPSCAPGCEERGNCNAALGVCECPIGYMGATCSEPVWPSCKPHPDAEEMYCSSNHPVSCDCLRECEAFVCQGGGCERHLELQTATCFERSPLPRQSDNGGAFSAAHGAAWNGGSSIPEANETGVKYYRGSHHPPYSDQAAIPREKCLLMGKTAVIPATQCTASCHMRGVCVMRWGLPYCECHYGFTGSACERADPGNGVQRTCLNDCNGRGRCRRGFCHCHRGWWGKDCSSSKVFAERSQLPLPHKLRVYVYDLPWQMSYQPELHLGFRGHDPIYVAYLLFAEMMLQDAVVRTEDPWEANLFWIPALTYAYSNNLGDSVSHARRAIDHVRRTWPFFNASMGTDHFIWLPADRGACFWPGLQEPALANIIKVVHFGFHHSGERPPEGWPQLPNKHWGCFHRTRDIVAATHWAGQDKQAAATFGQGAFNASHVPPRLLFFAGDVRPNSPDYSNGVRQRLHALFGDGQHPNVTVIAGHISGYAQQLAASKFCLAPSGHGWGNRLGQSMVAGCVPLIIQDDVYQPWEDQLKYSEFSVRVRKRDIERLPELLGTISDEEYVRLRQGVAKHWPAFVWDRNVGGRAYEYMISSLTSRWAAQTAGHGSSPL